MSTLSYPHPTVVRHGVRDWVAEHPVTSFFVLAYAYSWLLWAAPALGYRHGAGALLVALGVFGPPAAAMTVVRLTGTPIRGWLAGVLRWRVAPRWYLAALGFPAAFAALMSLEYALVRDELDVGLLGERLAVFVPVLIVCLLLQGGPEEPGWRGFALPRLQEVLTPVRATLLLGLVWALWHLPVLFVSDHASHGLDGAPFTGIVLVLIVGIVGYAFTYTYLYNRTGSALLCMFLHASYNASLGLFVLVPDAELEGSAYATMALMTTATIVAVAAALVIGTRGRLGREA